MGFFARKSEAAARAARVEPLRSAPVEVQVMGRDSLDVLLARNVSATGLGVYVPHGFLGFDLAAEVELVVTLPRRTPFLARGIIKHVTDDEGEARHFGLHFTQIKKAHRRAIEDYVRTRLA
jgi:c-di-GMP-binding flagellar brake protein YcgR